MTCSPYSLPLWIQCVLTYARSVCCVPCPVPDATLCCGSISFRKSFCSQHFSQASFQCETQHLRGGSLGFILFFHLSVVRRSHPISSCFLMKYHWCTILYWFHVHEWSNNHVHYKMLTTLCALTICHHTKVLQYYWRYSLRRSFHSRDIFFNGKFVPLDPASLVSDRWGSVSSELHA